MSKRTGMGIGDRVTGEPRRYFDGTPNPAWPNPHYLGTVIRRNDHHGHAYAVVFFDSGRRESVRCDALTVIRSARIGQPVEAIESSK